MKKVLAFAIVLFSFLSCSDEDPTCNLEVYAYECETIYCDLQIPLHGLTIEIYPSEEDAMNGFNLIETSVTNSEGIANFTRLPCELIYVKLVTEDFGTYIDQQPLPANASLSFHDIRFLKGFAYQENDQNSLVQNHISLCNPAVGQESRYKYYQNYSHISYTPLEYSDVELSVKIIDQLTVNAFVIEETIDSIYGLLGAPIYQETESVKTIWILEDDSIHVRAFEEDFLGSFIWNISGFWYPIEEDGYSFSLNRPSINGIDMASDEVYESNGWRGTGYAEDYTLLGHFYDELITDKISFQGTDGPLKIRVYSKEGGVVRSLDFNTGGSQATQGFDLILE